MAIQTAPFQVVMKNYMLDQWRQQGVLSIIARDGVVQFSSATVTFPTASNGVLSVASNITLTVPSDDTYTLTNFILSLGGTSQMQWTLPSPQQETFTDGGNIVITTLQVVLEDE